MTVKLFSSVFLQCMQDLGRLIFLFVSDMRTETFFKKADPTFIDKVKSIYC